MAVDDQFGLACNAVSSVPIQLSPLSIDAGGCWPLPPSGPSGSTNEYAGNVPCFASCRMVAVGTRLRCWAPYQHFANVGHGDHRLIVWYRRHGRCLASSRSKIVGTFGTFVGANAPPYGYFFASSVPRGAGMHDGCNDLAPVVLIQSA